MHHVSGVFDLDYKSKKKGKTVSAVYDMVSKQQLRLHEQADLEIRKYALSGTGSYGKLSASGRKTKYGNDCMGRNRMLRPGNGINLHTSGTSFL